MGQSAQDGHLFFVHKIHRKNHPAGRSGKNVRSPTVDIVKNWKLSRDISRDRCPQRSVREAANMMVLCTGAGAPKASPEGKLSSEARLMRATGGNLTGCTTVRLIACRYCTPALIRPFGPPSPPGEGRRLRRKKPPGNSSGR